MPITGTPLAKVGDVSPTACARASLAVPAICDNCRQVDRWLERSVTWTTKTFSRYKNILKAVLVGHDEILKAFCGSCFGGEGNLNCDCLLAEYAGYGLPAAIVTHPPNDACLEMFREIKLYDCAPDCLAGCITCLKIIDPATTPTFLIACGHVCPPDCVVVTFDPCNNPLHLDVLTRVLTAKRLGFNKLATGSLILAIVNVLFPLSTPALVSINDGTVYVNIGRAMTLFELTYLEFFKEQIPRGFGVSIAFVKT